MWAGGTNSWGAAVAACLLAIALGIYLLSGANGWQLLGGGLLYCGLAIHFAADARRKYREQRTEISAAADCDGDEVR